jgi:hypothetical protein
VRRRRRSAASSFSGLTLNPFNAITYGSVRQRESFAKNPVRENLDQRPADHQVLLDLEVLHPRRFCPPLCDEIAWDHSSASTFALT